MDSFLFLMNGIIDLLKTPLNIWGVEFSLWGVFIFGCMGSIVFSFIGGFFNG